MAKKMQRVCEHSYVNDNGHKGCRHCDALFGILLTPTLVLSRIMQQFSDVVERYETMQIKFIEDAQKDPEQAIRWHGAPMMEAQFLMVEAKSALYHMTHENPSFEAVETMLRARAQEMTDHLLKPYRFEEGSSSCTIHNLSESRKSVAGAKFLEMLKGWILPYFDQLKKDAALPKLGQ